MGILSARVVGAFGVFMLVGGAICVGVWVYYDWSHPSTAQKYEDECTGNESAQRKINDTEFRDYCYSLAPEDPLGGLAALIFAFCGVMLMIPGVVMVLYWVSQERVEKARMAGPPQYPPQYYYPPGQWGPPPPGR